MNFLQIIYTGRRSSVVEQRFCKPSVPGSNPGAGSILYLRMANRQIMCNKN
jgi:hypothetical protein